MGSNKHRRSDFNRIRRIIAFRKELEEEHVESDNDNAVSDKNEPEISISNEETEAALSKVKDQIKPDQSSRKSSYQGNPKKTINKTVWLTAATILLAFLIGYLMIPVQINVAYGDMEEVELPDGSVVELNSGSILTYNRLFDYFSRNVTLEGEAFFQVSKGETPFILEANGAIVEVKGTEFNVRSWRDTSDLTTTVTVFQGEVEFYSDKNGIDRVSLTDGLSSSLQPDRAGPTEPENVQKANIVAWRNNNFAFSEQSLEVIFSELERRFDEKIEVDKDAEGILQERLTAFYSQPDSIEKVLGEICTIKGLNYTKTANVYRVFRD